jgi:YHS domain-containing protein
MRRTLLSICAGLVMIGSAAAETKGEYGNMCAMGYAMEKDFQTDCSINAEHEGKTYCFGNEEAKAMFMEDPAGNISKAEAYAAKKS